ncbi:calcium-activated potassium channel subunit beta-2-like isoform X2 [Antennarius striatus]|uniref:calcium-activated potassium channel subunit beta-2-like isoform X2 n=1 Tax=Antennarius striatus TaxID=241820 RepID=UPI0035B259BE
MFFVAGARNSSTSGGGNERRSFYQKFREVDLIDKKKTVTALKPGEDRAILLGLGMILSSVMMYFVLGITILRSYADRYRLPIPHLKQEVYVSVNNTGRVSRLSHNEETQDTSSECFYVPRCQKDSVSMHVMIMNISERLKANTQVPCYYDPSEQQETVLLTRLYDHAVVFQSLLWPSCMLTGGALIIVMVKLTQYLSRLCEEIGKIKR